MAACAVSVIVTVYQQRHFLPLLLKALEQQDYPARWQLVVCDDGSTDGVLDVLLQSPLAKEPDFRYVYQADLGFRAGTARNNGIRCCHGQILVFLDGDSVPDRELVRRHVEAHNGSPRLVFGSRSYIFLEKYPLQEVAQLLNFEGSSRLAGISHMPTAPFQQVRFGSSRPWTALCGCNFSAWRDVAVSFDESYVGWGIEDYELALRLWTEHGYEIRGNVEAKVFHLESTPPATFHPLRPKEAQAIALYVANVLRITDRHPSADLRSLWETLCEFALDRESNTWRLLAPGERSSTLLEMIELARCWSEGAVAGAPLMNAVA